MSKLTRAWVEAQIEHELERGCHAEAVRDLAALLIVHKHMCKDGGADMRQYGRRYDPERQSTQMRYSKQEQSHHQVGYTEGDEEHLTAEEAEEWVRGMESEDGKKGGRWELQDIMKYASNYGVKPEEVVEFYAVLNALATDYGKVAKRFGVDRMEFWAELAKAFMHDKDAQPGKVKLYYECIAKKDKE